MAPGAERDISKKQDRNLLVNIVSVLSLVVTCITFVNNRVDKILNKIDEVANRAAIVERDNAVLRAKMDDLSERIKVMETEKMNIKNVTAFRTH